MNANTAYVKLWKPGEDIFTRAKTVRYNFSVFVPLALFICLVCIVYGNESVGYQPRLNIH